MLFLYYPKCSTCIKAKKWLESHDFSAEIRDLTTDTPSVRAISLVSSKRVAVEKVFQHLRSGLQGNGIKGQITAAFGGRATCTVGF